MGVMVFIAGCAVGARGGAAALAMARDRAGRI